MYNYEFPRPSVTATIVVYNRYKHCFLIGKRSIDAGAYPDTWSFPGGFLNAKSDTFEGETIERCAIRELKEETGIKIEEDQLQLVSICSNPDVDPRAHVVNICYLVNLANWQTSDMKAGDDLQELEWLRVQNVRELQPGALAFNHVKIANDALTYLGVGF